MMQPQPDAPPLPPSPAPQLTVAAALQRVAGELGLDPSLPPKQLAADACRELDLPAAAPAALRAMVAQACAALEIETGWGRGAAAPPPLRTVVVVAGGWDASYRRLRTVKAADLAAAPAGGGGTGGEHAAAAVWKQLPELRVARAAAAMCVTDRNTVVVAGGDSATGGRSAEALLPGASSWVALPEMATGRAGASACWLQGDLVAVIGGVGTDGILGSVEVLPLAAILGAQQLGAGGDGGEGGGWRSRTPMHTPRTGFGIATVPNDGPHRGARQVIVVGGEVQDGSRGISQSVEVYDVAADRWTPVAHSAGGADGGAFWLRHGGFTGPARREPRSSRLGRDCGRCRAAIAGVRRFWWAERRGCSCSHRCARRAFCVAAAEDDGQRRAATVTTTGTSTATATSFCADGLRGLCVR
eukprot:SAG22_NODE_46_length_24705_cov_89.861010_12_plen_414_part_00